MTFKFNKWTDFVKKDMGILGTPLRMKAKARALVNEYMNHITSRFFSLTDILMKIGRRKLIVIEDVRQAIKIMFRGELLNFVLYEVKNGGKMLKNDKIYKHGLNMIKKRIDATYEAHVAITVVLQYLLTEFIDISNRFRMSQENSKIYGYITDTHVKEAIEQDEEMKFILRHERNTKK